MCRGLQGHWIVGIILLLLRQFREALRAGKQVKVAHRVAPYLVSENCSQSCQPAQEPDEHWQEGRDLAV